MFYLCLIFFIMGVASCGKPERSQGDSPNKKTEALRPQDLNVHSHPSQEQIWFFPGYISKSQAQDRLNALLGTDVRVKQQVDMGNGRVFVFYALSKVGSQAEKGIELLSSQELGSYFKQASPHCIFTSVQFLEGADLYVVNKSCHPQKSNKTAVTQTIDLYQVPTFYNSLRRFKATRSPDVFIVSAQFLAAESLFSAPVLRIQYR